MEANSPSLTMQFKLLDPADIQVGDFYLSIDRVLVSGILPDRTTSFSASKLSKPVPQEVNLDAILPYIISQVDEKGFICDDADGEPAIVQNFDAFMDGMVVAQRDDGIRLYVAQQFLDRLSEYDEKEQDM